MLEKWLQVNNSACYCKLISAVPGEQTSKLVKFIKTSIDTERGEILNNVSIL